MTPKEKRTVYILAALALILALFIVAGVVVLIAV